MLYQEVQLCCIACQMRHLQPTAMAFPGPVTSDAVLHATAKSQSVKCLAPKNCLPDANNATIH